MNYNIICMGMQRAYSNQQIEIWKQRPFFAGVVYSYVAVEVLAACRCFTLFRYFRLRGNVVVGIQATEV